MPLSKIFHIVIFTGGNFPAPEATAQFWKNRKPDYVIAADSGLTAQQIYSDYFSADSNLSFSPDAVLGDFDSISDKSVLEKFDSHKIIAFSSYKDETDTEIALLHAHKIDVPENLERFITLVGGTGGRIDHTIAVYDSFSESYRADAWLTTEQAVYFFPRGSVCEISNLSKADLFSVSRLSASYDSGAVETEGVEWGGELFRKKGMASISNRINSNSSGTVSLKAVGGDFLVITPLSANVDLMRRNFSEAI